jgi:hypothetical protein
VPPSRPIASANTAALARRAGASVLALAVVAGAVLLRPAPCCGAIVDVLAWAGWLCGVALLVLVAAEAFELVELGLPGEPDDDAATAADARGHAPMLSIHVPICAEPPALVERTLRALAALPYEAIEIIVVDNNTADAALWQPVERLCRELGPRLRFFRLPRWPGYKAGALNFALAQTAERAEIVAVVDADYEVGPGFVDLVAHFADPGVAFAQAPQDYRDWDGRGFTRVCYWEYWQFFAVSMRLRRPRNAILMHGTMVMIRKSALLAAGGWSEWCLTEDSELGLRLLAAGHRAVYRSRSLGHGLVPFTSRDYKRQRARWVTGGMQTLARRWRWFLPGNDVLTTAQKLHYLQGWAPWLRDGIVVAATPLAVLLAGHALWDGGTTAALLPLSTAVLAVVAYVALRECVVYRVFLRRPWSDVGGAALAIVGLVPTAGIAVVRSVLRRRLAFERTPKQRQAAPWMGTRVAWELAAAATAAALALALLRRFGSAGAPVAAGLLAHAAVYASSLATDVLSRRR